ncbi:hypothetical protein NPX13_g9955 [Xylaria arbuscula]|uniref:Heterokaryon incompatibility domain-containing protein n=1 Tax=Xylaria arbuscula TaxID=114810 RepID=A0A9W8N5F5_9PEZI|nr:hypothetical protein NPX13_g9955 [Xylaria arbuscula]
MGIDLAGLQGANASAWSGRDCAPFLQAWLCFGIVSEVSRLCSVHFDASDLIEEREAGYQVISFAKLEAYAWFWCSTEWHYPIKERENHIGTFHGICKTANAIVNWRHQVVVADAESVVLLSIMCLVDYLVHNGRFIFGVRGFRLNWVRSKRLDDTFLQAGWCRGELESLYRECSTVVLLCLSTIRRTRADKDHSHCSGDTCVANQLDTSTYVPSHAASCAVSTCVGIVEPDVLALCDVLTSGGIPLVRLLMDGRIEIGAFDLSGGSSPVYVAISHVWSDGMGNPSVNGLNACQLQRIQNCVNKLFPDEVGNTFFWMDTLCVPLQTNIRNTAIVRMAKTYAHASKVLVLDSWLEQWDFNGDPRQLAARISISDWNQRLWTYQEALLARECRFQLAAECPTIDHLVDPTCWTGAVDRISNYLISQPESLFSQRAYAATALKAVMHLNDYFTSSIQFQQCEDGEAACYGISALRRVGAIFRHEALGREEDLESGSSRQTKRFDEPHKILFETAIGMAGRMTSRREDETICLGGIIGLDVSSILTVSINQAKRKEEVDRVCALRMIKFFLALGRIGQAILFFRVPRLDQPGFHWAPTTFMNVSIADCTYSFAPIKEKGLISKLRGMRLGSLGLAGIQTHDYLCIRWSFLYSDGVVIPLTNYISICKEFCTTLTGYETQDTQDVVLFTSAEADNFLAVRAGIEYDYPAYRYLFHASDIAAIPSDTPFLTVEGEELKEQTVCIS